MNQKNLWGFSPLLISTFILCIGTTFFGLTWSALAQGGGNTTYSPPKWKFERHQEDWSALRNAPASRAKDVWDSLKFISLNNDGSSFLSVGGHMRFRVENWNDFAFGAPADSNDTFLLWRTKIHTDFHFGKNFRVFLEGKSALSTDRSLPGGRRTIDVDTIELQQAFFDVRIPIGNKASLTIRPGRQELLLGKQRLVSPLPWGNTLRHWDGITSDLTFGNWHVNGFWTQFAPVSKHDFNNSTPANELFGIYGAGKVAGFELDLYWLGIDRDSATFNGTSGPEERHTFGGRLNGKVPNTHFDFELEGGHQTGSVGAGDVNAYFFASQFGYRLADIQWKPRLYLGFDYASGDGEAGGNVGTFNQMFPLGHAYLGFIDIVARQNIIDFSQGVAIKPLQKLTFKVDSHFFWRADNADALYNAGGGVVRAGSLGNSREIGTEIDVTASITSTGTFGRCWATVIYTPATLSKNPDRPMTSISPT